MQPLTIFVSQFLKPVLKGFNPIILILMRNWKLILSEKYYTYCTPKKVVFQKGKKGDGTLYITAYNNIATFYIANNSIAIIEKINALNGYNIVKDIKVQLEPKIII
jgi:hypothetical protein